MARTTGSFPDDLHDLIEGAVTAGVFESKSDALRQFTREYFADHPNERIAAAVSLYETEDITLGTAARLADVNRFEMRDILRDHDVDLRIGLMDETDVEDEVKAATDLTFTDEMMDNDETANASQHSE